MVSFLVSVVLLYRRYCVALGDSFVTAMYAVVVLYSAVDLENDPGMFAWMYERLVRLNESRAAVESQSKSKFSLGEALVHRTRMYKDHVRWWYEAYFLTRRTMFTLLSVIFRNDDMRRSVSGLVWMLMTLVWRRSYSVVMCGMFVLVMCEHEQQLVFLAALLALFFQCRVQPYRIPTANMREVILLCFLCLATGYELLRVTPVYTAGEWLCVFVFALLVVSKRL
jgi:hypothetical protein